METRRASTRNRRESVKVEAAKAEAAQETSPIGPSPKRQKLESPLRKKVHKIHARNSDVKVQSNLQTPKSSTSSSSHVKSTPLPTKGLTIDLVEDSRELQSIAESGVLAASLQKSRTKWLTEGFFERYWMKPPKPSKKKDQPEVPSNNPAKESMSKLGACQIVLEPHTFDATLFTLKSWPPPASQPKPQPKPIIQYGVPTPTNAASNSVHTAPLTKLSPQAPQQSSGPASSPAPVQTPTQQPQAINESRNASPSATSSGSRPSPAPQPRTTQPVQQPGTASAQSSANSQPPSKPSQDPVIQMLAQRASTSPELKILMKIVASGHASPAQLKVFQSHIDDLTGILQRQNKSNTNTTANTGASTSTVPNPTPSQPSVSTTQTPFRATPPVYHQPLAAPKPKPFVYPKFETIGTAIEFAAGSGDRYWFPRHSVLEYNLGSRELKASFLIVRKGSTSDTGVYEASKEYYQPVTMTVLADQPSTLETIARNVASLDEAKKHMDEVMQRATRAEDKDLTLRLPKHGAGDQTGTPGPDSRRSFKTSLGRDSPAVGSGRGSKHKHDDYDHMCRYCYVTVPTSQARDGEGMCVCQECALLTRRSGMAVLPMRQVRGIAESISSGPQTLMLPPEVY
ncbi:MAG: hypothetical protein M1828_002263 [Chrysothrix sp. TS-e1954]|nr:MAG: hypothetical protein M1828_002263 [Chrysothrix sp. TS-e1954]